MGAVGGFAATAAPASPFVRASPRSAAAGAASASELPQNLQNCAPASALPLQRPQVRVAPAGAAFARLTTPTGTIGFAGEGIAAGADASATGTGSSVLPHEVQYRSVGPFGVSQTLQRRSPPPARAPGVGAGVALATLFVMPRDVAARGGAAAAFGGGP